MIEAATHVKQKALAAAQPLTVHLELTYRCNWRCVFCYNPRHSDVAPLTAGEWSDVLDELRSLGTFTLILTGGEPLAHPEFFTIAEEARRRRFALRIFTNGSLIDDAAARRLRDVHPLAVELSLHGATAAVHDRATARPGSFEAMFRGIDLLAQYDVPIVLKTPVTSMNEHQIDDIAALAAARGLPLQLDPHITPRDDGSLAPLQFSASREAVRRVFELEPELYPMERTRGGVNCGLGRLTMAIDPEGNVYPCMQWRQRALGNVRETPLGVMWRTSRVREETAAISVEVNDRLLEQGGPLSELAFCPALAMQETGSPFVPDDAFRARAEIASAIRQQRTS